MHPATGILATDWGSPHGVLAQDKWVRELWDWSYYFAIPIGALVVGLIAFALVRYRHRPGHERTPAQFQYHIPIEAIYTIAPLVVVAIIFGLMFKAENHQTKVSSHPDVKIQVQGFQWGWRFLYDNGHSQVGTGDYDNINDNKDLPVLVIPADRTVQLQVVSLDVVHTFYVKKFLFNRDLIPGVDNRFDVDVKTPGTYPGQCNNICGEYHAYMRFFVQVLPPDQYDAWYRSQAPCSTTTATETGSTTSQGTVEPDGKCAADQIPGLNNPN